MNSIIYADINIFLRYLTGEPAFQAEKVSLFFKKMETGLYKLYVCDIVVLELVYVLEKIFELSKKEISEKVKAIMLKKNIVMENKQIIFNSLDSYRDLNIDFADSYIYSHLKKRKRSKIFSFDEHFRRFEDIEIILE